MSSNQALSFSSVYDKFYIKILHYLKRMAGKFEDVEFTQTVFEKISRNLSSFKGESKLSPGYIGLPAVGGEAETSTILAFAKVI